MLLIKSIFTENTSNVYRGENVNMLYSKETDWVGLNAMECPLLSGNDKRPDKGGG